MYEIDDDVPMPEPDSIKRTGPNRKYPFDELAVGQSFFVPVGDEASRVVRSRVATSLRQARRTPDRLNGVKFRLALVTEDGVLGVRCWRVE